MNIVHVVEPFAAGIATFVKSLTETLSNDHHIVIHGERKPVMSAEDVRKSFPNNNVQFIRWHYAQREINPFMDALAVGELYSIFQKLKRKNLVDAVHLHSSKSGILGRAACRMSGITNIIYTPNGASFLSGKNRISNFFYQHLEKIANGFGGQVICCSESEYEEYKKIGIDAYYVNNGVPLTKPLLEQTKKDKHFRIVTTGRIVDQKNPSLFNRIASYFENQHNIEFTWIGDGEPVDKNQLTAGNIHVTGWLSAKAVRNIVANADVYISTSLYEGLSFSVLEALELQKPVLLTDCIGNRDVVRARVNGDYFKNESEAITKILQYYNNRSMLKVMGEFSRELCIEQFDQERNFTTYRNIYAKNIQKLMFNKMTGVNAKIENV